MSGLVKLLERSLSDPRRLRALLRFQSAVLTYWALTGEPGNSRSSRSRPCRRCSRRSRSRSSVPALLLEGIRHCGPPHELEEWGRLIFARQTVRGGNTDRAGLSPLNSRFTPCWMEFIPWTTWLASRVQPARRGGDGPRPGAAGLVERRSPSSADAILILDDDPETVRVVQRGWVPRGRIIN